MRPFTARERTLGNWLLAILFAVAGVATAPRTWELVRTEGLTLRSAIWLLAMLGIVSLVWRTVRAATRKGDSPTAAA
jgi:hypothetical protein